MAENKPLDDIILAEPDPQNGKSKGLLALLALIILLIIVGAILAKMIFSSSDATKSESNITQEQSVKTITDSNNDTNKLSVQDPDLAPLDDVNSTISNAASNVTNLDNGVVNDGAPVANSNVKTDNTSASNSTNETKLKTDTDEVIVEKISKPTQKTNPAHKIKQHPHPKPAVHHTVKKVYGGHGNVYIQVGSFTKGPQSNFIEKIRRAGFRFRIKHNGGVRRVYVGPFRSRGEAKSLLNKVRSTINPDAFIK